MIHSGWKQGCCSVVTLEEMRMKAMFSPLTVDESFAMLIQNVKSEFGRKNLSVGKQEASFPLTVILI